MREIYEINRFNSGVSVLPFLIWISSYIDELLIYVVFLSVVRLSRSSVLKPKLSDQVLQ